MQKNGNQMKKMLFMALLAPALLTACSDDDSDNGVENKGEENFVATAYDVYPMDPYAVSETTPLYNSYVRSFSPSGNYAVGYDDQSDNPSSFIWERSTGKYTILSQGSYGGCLAYDVNDEGVVVGSVYNEDGAEVPAMMDYKNGGTWEELPGAVPSVSNPSFAVAITNDGLIGGQVNVELKDGGQRCMPCYWRNGKIDFANIDLPDKDNS